jgi:oligoendopeptidase F
MAIEVVALPARGDVPLAERWDLESVFPTTAAWEAACAAANARLAEFERYRDRLGESASSLLAALLSRDEIGAAVERVTVFATLRRSEDATDTGAAALVDRGQALRTRFAAATAYFEPEIAALDPGTIETFFAADAGLIPFRHAVERIQRRRAHIRSAEVEEVLARATDVALATDSVHDALENGELPFSPIDDQAGQPVTLGQSNLQRYLRSADRRVRRAAWESGADAYLGFRHTFAAALAGSLKKDVFYANARGYQTALNAALDRDAIPTEVYHRLIETVRANFPTWHRYFRVRRRLLGLAEGDFRPQDIAAPLSTNDPAVSWDEGVDLICASLAPLGGDYVNAVRQGVADRWVDRAANVGKHGGAFSWGSHGTNPFISMTYKDDLFSVSTLTHELGHSMHSFLAWKAQPATYSEYSMFAAEVASNLHQALLGKHLLAMDDRSDWQTAVLEERTNNLLRYLFTMPILAQIELDAHTRIEAGEAVTADDLDAVALRAFGEGYGGELALDDEDRARLAVTWARFGHLYTAYYVFQYATGIAAAAAIAQMISDEGASAAERYLDFLRTGDARYPIDALRDVGVDMRSPEPVQRAFDILAGYVDRLEVLADS